MGSAVPASEAMIFNPKTPFEDQSDGVFCHVFVTYGFFPRPVSVDEINNCRARMLHVSFKKQPGNCWPPFEVKGL